MKSSNFSANAVALPGFLTAPCLQHHVSSEPGRTFIPCPMAGHAAAWNTWRAPTDNDAVFLEQWKRFHLIRLIPRVYSIRAIRSGETVDLVIHSSLGWQSHFPLARVFSRLHFSGSGAMEISADFQMAENRPPLPRLGLKFCLPGTADRADYLGYGPGESYSDKKESAWWGSFSEKADEHRENHVRPQESGAHTGCTLLVLPAENRKLRITSREPFSFRLTHFDQDLETAATHRDQLQPEKDTFLLLDYAQSGIGSASCGPAPAPEYLLNRRSWSLHFLLEPCSVHERSILK